MSRLIYASLLGLLIASPAMSQTAQNTKITYAYDLLGNLVEMKNGLNHVTKFSHDALSRRTRVTDPTASAGVETYTSYDYNLLDQLVKVTDARSVVTEYSIDGQGNLLQTSSADTGVVTNTYDEAGNLTSRKDAKGQLTRYQYDALNRVVLITYHDSSTVNFSYDATVNATGQLSGVTDISGSISYDYDEAARIKKETRVVGGVTYVTGYRYDETGRPAGIDYPSGRAINYQYDAQGRVRQIDAVQAGIVTSLVQEVAYEPFGPVKTITFGNGRTHTRSFDLEGRMSSYSLSAQTMKIDYDAASRIKVIADAANVPAATSYGYDVMDRLTSVQTPVSSQTYEYDAVGNRKKKVNNSATSTYAYGGPGNRLTAVGGQSIATDLNGSITNNGGASFSYDVRGRMISANTGIGLVQYTINALGQRVRKVTPSETTVFHYDLSGKLIAESTSAAGQVKTTEHVYLGDIPVAVLK